MFSITIQSHAKLFLNCSAAKSFYYVSKKGRINKDYYGSKKVQINKDAY